MTNKQKIRAVLGAGLLGISRKAIYAYRSGMLSNKTERRLPMKKQNHLNLVLVKFFIPIIIPVFFSFDSSAATINIVNATFESDIDLSPGQWTTLPGGSGIQTSNPIPGWNVTGLDTGLHQVPSGYFNDAKYAEQDFVYSGGTANSGGSFSQTVGLIEKGTYTFSIDVGWRKDLSFAGYKIEFIADGTVFASDVNGTKFVDDDKGEFKTVSYSVDLLGESPYLGKALSIRLSSAEPGWFKQTAFDNAKLNIATVPLPAAIWLFGSGLLGLIGIKLRRVV